MRVVRYHSKGPPDVLEIETVEAPTPAADEVLIRIEAALVSAADAMRRAGRYHPVPVSLPHIPGGLAVGVVETCGGDLDPSLRGRRYIANITTGAYAELGLAKAAQLRPIPEGVDPVNALAILSTSDTAGLAIRGAGRLAPGETVFVPGATGGIGALVAQLARLWGAGQVFGGASSEAKRDIVATLGATPIDYGRGDWASALREANGGKGVDLAFEVIGGEALLQTIAATRDGGRIVNYGDLSDSDSAVQTRLLRRRNIAFIGFYVTTLAANGLFVAEREAVRRDVDRFMRSGDLVAPIGGRFRLEDVREAHRVLETRSANGRLILMPNALSTH